MNTNTREPIARTNNACLPVFALAALLACAAPAVQSQTPGALDLSFDTGSTVTREVRAIVPTGAGKLYVGGVFTWVRGAARNYIARLNADGSADETFDPGTGADRPVSSIALQADGKVIIGGWFTSYNGTARGRVARLNSDGSLDTTFNPGAGASDSVYSVALQADGKVLIGGNFTNYNGTARNRIARLNSDGSLDTTFNPGAGANDSVHSIALQADGKVLIGGNFTNYNGTARNRIARLNSNGNLDNLFNPGTGASAAVYSVALQADGKVLIGGDFANYNGMARYRIARLNSNGSLDTTFNPGTGASDSVYSVALQADGKVLIGGRFTGYNGIHRNFIVRINNDGSLDTTFDFGGANGTVWSLALQADGKILIGGLFTRYDGMGRNRIARLHSDGTADDTFNPGAGADDTIFSIARQADGKVLIGGAFTSYNGTARNRIARLNSDASLDTTFNPGTGASGWVYSSALQADGKVLISGFFSSYNGTARNGIARLNSDGSLDPSFDPGSGATNTVSSAALQTDGKVLIGGYFSSYNGTARRYIARLNSDGSLDTTFDPGTGASDAVTSVALQADGKVLIGGWFTSYNGTARNRIARLNSDGSLDTNFNPGTGVNQPNVYSVALQADGKVLIAGWFSSYNGTARNCIARLNSDGSLDSTFDPGTGASDTVYSIAVQADGKVLLGGLFTVYNGTGRRFIARLNNNGSLDTTFDPGSGADSNVYSVTVQADGKALIGGAFLTYNRTGRSRLARLANNTAIESLSVPTASQVQWLRAGAAPEIEQVSFEHSADGASWTALGAGTRTSGGWELTGLNLSATGYLRARGRATAGYHSGSSSVIEQVVSYSTPTGKFDAWAAAAGLTGPDATPGAAPHGDGVPNILKYAFNMNGSGPDANVLVPGTGTNGLPVFALATGGPSTHFRCEFIRRIASGLIYTPKKNTDLSPLSWVPLTDSPTVLPINADWERVIYEEPCDPVTPKCFYRVEVTLP